jgi:hypothetical protein
VNKLHRILRQADGRTLIDMLISGEFERKEIKFVCHNSDSETSTDINSQKKLYDDLKKLNILKMPN